ncbi:Mov34/MPN/PAD-1 family protein [Emticicia sp. C21]|uniref:Mov34/MPN/PAD-1 family protein n=1 Tax=Emticicia sp. C21 TaxID=2302915 RepID=UPI000E350118|nr:Mov34/MPN/PAD-1 family protein [Emticicia sp. C21]RFS15687.1 hypothetical protein D0T08_16235 [Emticicia sp. C21]
MKISFYRWLCLTIGLRRRGKGIRESGAFLIGKVGSTRISKIIFYDELDPNAFKSGIIELEGLGHGKLAEMLKNFRGEVLADIHTHPIGCSTRQSDSDRRHPMVRLKGHIAFIAPDFALNKFLMPKDCSAYLYEGSFKWRTLYDRDFPLKVVIV